MKAVSGISKVWFRFNKSICNGKEVKFRWEQLPHYRFEEFLDFKMKYYVKHEITHDIAGIHTNTKAIDEYRNILARLYKSPSYHTAICCADDASNKMVGFSSMRLYRNGEICEDVIQAETPEVQKFNNILYKWNNLCPVPDIMSKYGVSQYFDDAGIAIHSDYRGYNFTKEAALLSPAVVGMLWEVTDLEVDKVVTSLVSLCVPSTARAPWSAVGKEKWSQGTLDTKVESSSSFTREPDLLRAIVRSRGSSNFVMIGSSMVSRGLPVRIR